MRNFSILSYLVLKRALSFFLLSSDNTRAPFCWGQFCLRITGLELNGTFIFIDFSTKCLKLSWNRVVLDHDINQSLIFLKKWFLLSDPDSPSQKTYNVEAKRSKSSFFCVKKNFFMEKIFKTEGKTELKIFKSFYSYYLFSPFVSNSGSPHPYYL